MDTAELGAEQNPVPDEPEKTFQFDFNATISGYGVVTAKSKDEALELIKNGDYDDIIETYGMELEEVTKIEEE